MTDKELCAREKVGGKEYCARIVETSWRPRTGQNKWAVEALEMEWYAPSWARVRGMCVPARGKRRPAQPGEKR